MSRISYTVPRLRAVKVDFKVVARDNVQLNKHTGSMWRGFLKKPMRDRLCVMDLDPCNSCPIVSRCGYGHIWEQPSSPSLSQLGFNNPQAGLVPAPLPEGAPLQLKTGDRTILSYHLFGSAVTHLPELIQGFRFACRTQGLGAQNRRIGLEQVVVRGADDSRVVFDTQEGLMLPWRTPEPLWISPEFAVEGYGNLMLHFETPLHLRAHDSKHCLRKLDLHRLTLHQARRLTQLASWFEGFAWDLSWVEPLVEQLEHITVLSNTTTYTCFERWSGRRNRHEPLEGLQGHAILGNVHAGLIALWQTASWTLTGRHTNFGLGRINVNVFGQTEAGRTSPFTFVAQMPSGQPE